MKTDLKQHSSINQLLVSIVLDVERHYNIELTKTSGHRPGDKGVHGVYPSRGIDISCPDHDFGKLIEKYTNSKYQYDPGRPDLGVCLYHDSGSGLHLHFQVHPNTIVTNQ